MQLLPENQNYERTFRRKQTSNRGRGAVNLIHEEGTIDYSEIPEDRTSQNGSSVGWVNRSEAPSHSWDSDSSGNCLAMSVGSKSCTELKVAGAQ